MKLFLLKFFTWWNGQTFGTQLWTWRFGELVGQDEQGNRYYRTKGRKIDPTLGFERRWVIYNGYAEATRVPPSWHGWLHHTVDVAPTEESYTPREWEKPHVPEHDGHAGGLSSLRLDAGQRPPPQGDRRLPALDAGKLSITAVDPQLHGFRPRVPVIDHCTRLRCCNAIYACEQREQRGHLLARVLAPVAQIAAQWGHLTEMGNHRVGVGLQFATAPICSGNRSGYGREIGPRCRGSEIAR